MRRLFATIFLLSACQVETSLTEQELVFRPSCVSESLFGTRVSTSCGGILFARSTSGTLGTAAATVRSRFPNASVAAASNSPRFMGAHQTNGFGGQAELEGFGITYIQFTGVANPVENASGVLSDPNLLFFGCVPLDPVKGLSDG